MVPQEKIKYNPYKTLQWNCHGLKANNNELLKKNPQQKTYKNSNNSEQKLGTQKKVVNMKV